MKERFIVSKQLKTIIEQDYEFNIQSIVQLKGGFANFNFKIKTTKGIFFLRIHDLITNISVVEQEHKLIRYLVANKFPTANIILTNTKKSYIIDQNKIMVLFLWIDGKPATNITKDVRCKVAKTLAQYHNIVRGFHEDIPKWGLSINQSLKETIDHAIIGFVDIIFEDMPWEKSAYQVLKNKKRLDAFEKYMINIRPYLAKIRDNIRFLHKTKKINDKTIIMHGDYWNNNILFKNKNIVGVIDFDTARAGPMKMEVIKGALEFSEFDINKLDEFIIEYQKENPIVITKYEILLYSQIMSMWQIGQNFKKFVLNNRKPTTKEIKTIKDHIAFLNKIDNNI